MINYGNPEHVNTKKLLEISINYEFFKNFANKSCGNEVHFSVCESIKKWVFQRAGPIILKVIFLSSLESIR